MALCEAYEGHISVGNCGSCGPLVDLLLVGIFGLVDIAGVGGSGIAAVFGSGVGALVSISGLEVSL